MMEPSERLSPDTEVAPEGLSRDTEVAPAGLSPVPFGSHLTPTAMTPEFLKINQFVSSKFRVLSFKRSRFAARPVLENDSERKRSPILWSCRTSSPPLDT